MSVDICGQTVDKQRKREVLIAAICAAFLVSVCVRAMMQCDDCMCVHI